MNFCAQRLSASTEGTPCRRFIDDIIDACSTPFGIYGRNTIGISLSRIRETSAQRLSASTEGTRGKRGNRCDQARVLNAFRHLRKEHALLQAQQWRGPSVLNAFRHLRKEHDWRGLAWFFCHTVLNAFRHLRKEHSCVRWRGTMTRWVLNAFRHLRKEHGSLHKWLKIHELIHPYSRG